MRITLAVIGALLGLWLAYTIWPFVTVYRLASAVTERSVAGVSERVDFDDLHGNLAVQISAAYLKATGKKINPDSLMDRLALGAAGSIVTPLVAEILKPEMLIELLQQGRLPPRILSVDAPRFEGLNPDAFSNVWRAYVNSEFRIGRFFLNVPFDKPPPDRFRLGLCLRHWSWKLCAIELPEPLLASLAQELVKREKH